jgi:hypothetical protein
LPELAAALEDLRRATATPRRGAWLAAALVFAVTMLGASWLEDQHALLSRPLLATSGLVATAQPDALTDETPAGRVETTLAPESVSVGTSGRPDLPLPAAESLTTPAVDVMPLPAPAIAPPPAPIPEAPVALHAALPASAAPSMPPPDAPPPAIVPQRVEVDEAALVRQALQRYRVAYDGLDAGSAQAVWPAVNEGALARAFDALESQTLTFDDCRVDLQSGTATATCRGTTRYVPKIGSRDPRTEPRVWNFSLRKDGSEWKIDNARVER